MLSTTTPSHLHRAPVHLENISRAPNTQFSLTPNARLNNFVKEKAKFAFSGTSELEPIPERPMTTTHSKDPMKTRATLSRTSQSLNSLSSRRGGIKTQGSFMESSIVLDFMTEAGGDTNGFQQKAVIRPVQKLKTQHFYNSVYDVREEEEPMEARIKQLEQLYKTKAENTLWNTPPQQLMRNVLESYARVQPKGIIKQYLDYMQDKSDVQKIQRKNNRPSSSTRGNAKARTVEGFFKDEQNQDKQEILQILRGQKKYQDMSKIAGKDITDSINDYISTLENCNTLLMSVRDPQSLENFENLLDETPEKSQGSKHSNEKPFERWSEESAHKTEVENVPKIHMNDYADIKEDANRKVRLIQFPAPNNETKSTSRLTKSAVNKINAISKGSSTNGLLQSTFYATKTKAIAIIRQRPSTTGSKPNSTHRIPFKEAVMNSLSVKNNNLMLEGKKALPEMLDNPYKFTSPKAPVMTDNTKEEECVSPKTPNNWVLEGMTIPKSEEKVAEKKDVTIFRRKGHINKQTRVSSAKTKNILSLMKRPNSENNASKRKNDRKTNEFARADQSPKDLLNAWASEESVIPSFKIKKIESSFEPQIIQEVL